MKLLGWFAVLPWFGLTVSSSAFVPSTRWSECRVAVAMSTDGVDLQNPVPCEPHPFSSLPGDPSLNIITNVDLGDKKLEVMMGENYGKTDFADSIIRNVPGTYLIFCFFTSKKCKEWK